MHWGNPNYLYALWLLPVVAWLFVRAEQKRRESAHRFAERAMAVRLMPAFGGARPRIKGTFVVLGLAMLVVAAARPRFGVYFEEMQQRGVDLFVLLDVSKSMLAEDVAPNRLDRAKSDVRDLLEKLGGDRVGLIAFAGRPKVLVPLTTDHEFVKSALDEMDIESAPRGGSLIGDAIRKAIESMPPAEGRDKVIVLITDGEDHESMPVDAAKQAAERGIKILAIGLGDPNEGGRIPVRDSAGQISFVKEGSQQVWSKLDEKLLQEIALATNGAYIPAKTRSYDLGEVYETHLANLQRGEIESGKRERHHEQFQWFAALGLAFLFVDGLTAGARSRLAAVGGLS